MIYITSSKEKLSSYDVCLYNYKDQEGNIERNVCQKLKSKLPFFNFCRKISSIKVSLDLAFYMRHIMYNTMIYVKHNDLGKTLLLSFLRLAPAKRGDPS